MLIPSKNELLSRKMNYHLRTQKTSIDNSHILNSSPTIDINSTQKFLKTDFANKVLNKINKGNLVLNENTSFSGRMTTKHLDTDNIVLMKNRNIFRNKLKTVEFSNFQEKYDYHSSYLMANLKDLMEQLNKELLFKDLEEERNKVIKTMKEQKELSKKQLSDLNNKVLSQLENYKKTKEKIKSSKLNEPLIESSSPFSKKFKHLSELNTILKNKKKGYEKQLKIITDKLNHETDEKRSIMNLMNTSKKLNPFNNRVNKLNEIESIEKEIIEYKINSYKKELALKDKQIKILREKFNNATNDQSCDNSMNVDITDEINNSYLNFEEDFNVTNNSNESFPHNINDYDKIDKNDSNYNGEFHKKTFQLNIGKPIPNTFILDNEFKTFNKSRDSNNGDPTRSNNKSCSSNNNQLSNSTNHKEGSNKINNSKSIQINQGIHKRDMFKQSLHKNKN